MVVLPRNHLFSSYYRDVRPREVRVRGVLLYPKIHGQYFSILFNTARVYLRLYLYKNDTIPIKNTPHKHQPVKSQENQISLVSHLFPPQSRHISALISSRFSCSDYNTCTMCTTTTSKAEEEPRTPWQPARFRFFTSIRERERESERYARWLRVESRYLRLESPRGGHACVYVCMRL